MHYLRGYWSIPKAFFDINTKKSDSISKELLENGCIIDSPKIFNGSEINQTKQLKKRFFTTASENDSNVEIQNPEEIELDL